MDAYTVILDAPSEASRRIQIAQLGDFKDGRYGEFAITREDVENWKANLSRLPGGRALIDLDHRADRSPRNSEAAGWITGIDWEDDTPVAEVDWTPVGEQAIADKRYLFFSPTYGDFTDESGDIHENVLQGGALTNKPFITSMPALTLASEEKLAAAAGHLEERNDDRLLDALTSKARNDLPASDFVFPDDRRYPINDIGHARNALSRASGKEEEAAVKAAVYKRYPELKPGETENDGDSDDGGESDTKKSDSQRTMDTEVIKALGLAEDTDVPAILDRINTLTARADVPRRSLEQRAADNGKVVLDQNDFDRLRKDAASGERAQAELKSQMFDVAFTRAVENGRAVPDQRPSLEHFYELDAEKALDMLNNGPKVVNTRSSGWNNGQVELDDAPAGIEQGSHQAAQKVRARVRALGKSMDDFHQVFEQMMAEGEL